MPTSCLLRAAAATLFVTISTMTHAAEWKSGIEWQTPPVIDAGGPNKAPSDAIVLFDGMNMDAFHGGDKCPIADGAFTVGTGITTKQEFGDVQLHLEFATPEKVEGSGQGRGNSGVYLMGRYEVQVLDSFENDTYVDGQAASIYKQSPPLVNASRKPGEWQSYDIIFDAPKFNDDGSVAKPARVTVLHNGVLVQHAYELQGGTFYDQPPKYEKHPEKQPIHIQFHGNPVRYRNIWLREFKQLDKKLPEEKQP